jgi:Cys-rich protein (TIGR01571 family)
MYKGEYAQVGGQDANGDELLLAPDVETDAVADAVPMIQVTAPATLQEGYKMDVQVGSRTFGVTVPPGGVSEGQTFQVPLPGGASNENLSNLSMATARVAVPVGQWRDGICDCFSQGPCHPVLWNAFLCPSIVIGQVMTRLQLNLWSKPLNIRHGAREAAKMTFQVLLAATIVESIYYFIIRPTYYMRHTHFETYERYDVDFKETVTDVKQVPNEGYETAVVVSEQIGMWTCIIFYAFVVILTTRTRSYIRQKYGIPARYCSSGGASSNNVEASTRGCHFEDFICSCCCICCTSSQMARHTMEYDTYPGTCCTPTGVRDAVPDVV